MSELYDRADNMFGELVIPESFSEALSYAEQLIWLYLHKQNELIEGENITITDNGDGTATISASVDGVKGIDRIESTVGVDKTVVVVYYTDGTHQSFNVLAGPQGPQGIQGIPGVQGDPGVGVPAGGTAGQTLVKNSGTNYDGTWRDSLSLLHWAASFVNDIPEFSTIQSYVTNVTGKLKEFSILQTLVNNTPSDPQSTILCNLHITPQITFSVSVDTNVAKGVRLCETANFDPGAAFTRNMFGPSTYSPDSGLLFDKDVTIIGWDNTNGLDIISNAGFQIVCFSNGNLQALVKNGTAPHTFHAGTTYYVLL